MTTHDDDHRFGDAELMRRITDVIVSDAVGEIDSCHIVVCTDPITGVVAYSGPYASGLSALYAAEQDLRAELSCDPKSSMRFSVAPLLSPGGPVS